MKKKTWFLILGIIVVFVISAVFLWKMEGHRSETAKLTTQQKAKKWVNPYGNMKLHTDTIAELHDPNYQNIILPKELDEKIAKKESFFLYFYSASCSHCKVASPIIHHVVTDLNLDVKAFNLLEFEDGWGKYGIEGTPTIMYYQKGKPVSKIEGEQTYQVYKNWFTVNLHPNG